MKRWKVLISAYACEPGKGSEPNVGWNVAREMARQHDVWVLTRANNRRP
ncbi:MAG TPA: glycosyltransferase family 1 protein, partial [Dehalococcoidia bacterium]|nr:glycosyltransferase family 1 protein [Dehalococcoidia bacterium]